MVKNIYEPQRGPDRDGDGGGDGKARKEIGAQAAEQGNAGNDGDVRRRIGHRGTSIAMNMLVFASLIQRWRLRARDIGHPTPWRGPGPPNADPRWHLH